MDRLCVGHDVRSLVGAQVSSRVVSNLSQPVPVGGQGFSTRLGLHDGRGPGRDRVLSPLSASVLPSPSSSGVNTLTDGVPKSSSSRTSDLVHTSRSVDPRPDSGFGSTPVSLTRTHTRTHMLLFTCHLSSLWCSSATLIIRRCERRC